MPQINVDRITKNKSDILEIKTKITEIIDQKKESFLKDSRNPLALKYMLIQIVESVTDTCQHILAKTKGIACLGYTDCLEKAGDNRMISIPLAKKLKKLANLRNNLIHRYWIIDDEELLDITKKNIEDFDDFVHQIDDYIKKSDNQKERGGGSG